MSGGGRLEDWTTGAEAIVYQSCAACGNLQYFRRSFCSACGAPDPVELQRGDRLFNEFAAVLDAHLTDRRWISGTSLTLADLSIAAPVHQQLARYITTSSRSSRCR